MTFQYSQGVRRLIIILSISLGASGFLVKLRIGVKPRPHQLLQHKSRIRRRRYYEHAVLSASSSGDSQQKRKETVDSYQLGSYTVKSSPFPESSSTLNKKDEDQLLLTNTSDASAMNVTTLQPSSLEESRSTTSTTNKKKNHDLFSLWNEATPSAAPPSSTDISTTTATKSDGKHRDFFSLWPITSANYPYLGGNNKTAVNKVNKTTAKRTSSLRNQTSKIKSKSGPKPLVTSKDPNQVLTLADLEEILQINGYVRQSDLEDENGELVSFSKSRLRDTKDRIVEESSSGRTSLTTRTRGGVAFPQQSILTYKDVKRGCTVAGGLTGMILAATALSNLWLLGMLFGGVYGYSVATTTQERQQEPSVIWARGILHLGRKCAKYYLKVYDAVNGIWFMYKTGQLSYDYYKQYAKLDDRFGIGEKLDAWNARFQEGKQNFDAWEQQHEVGRKLLAGVRTAWLVEEKSLRKRRGKVRSKYRIVQALYDSGSWCRSFVVALWNSIGGGSSEELGQVLRGIRINVSESQLNEIGPRLGAALMAVLTLSMVGALYSLSARLLLALAIVTGLVWPTWVEELSDRFRLLFAELRATGRGEDFVPPSSTTPTTRRQQQQVTSRRMSRSERNRYHFYKRSDGSKRWYRTGRPAFRSDQPEGKTDSIFGGLLGGDAQKKNKNKSESRKSSRSWGLFGS